MYERFQFRGQDPHLRTCGIYYIKIRHTYSRGGIFSDARGLTVSIYTTKKKKIMDCPYDTLTAFLDNWKKV